MTTIILNRGEKKVIPFSITDAANGLATARVTWLLGQQGDHKKVLLKKASALPGSSADVTITAQTASQITGTIVLTVADTLKLAPGDYRASLWVDTDTGDDRCTTAGGFDTVTVNFTVPRV